eukprot:Rhum_TRINITY_DN9896_c0_g1::Rhum_TRINITY_DN9896_c0_g1_i1::g.35441::m.35441
MYFKHPLLVQRQLPPRRKLAIGLLRGVLAAALHARREDGRRLARLLLEAVRGRHDVHDSAHALAPRDVLLLRARLAHVRRQRVVRQQVRVQALDAVEPCGQRQAAARPHTLAHNVHEAACGRPHSGAGGLAGARRQGVHRHLFFPVVHAALHQERREAEAVVDVHQAPRGRVPRHARGRTDHRADFAVAPLRAREEVGKLCAPGGNGEHVDLARAQYLDGADRARRLGDDVLEAAGVAAGVVQARGGVRPAARQGGQVARAVAVLRVRAPPLLPLLQLRREQRDELDVVTEPLQRAFTQLLHHARLPHVAHRVEQRAQHRHAAVRGVRLAPRRRVHSRAEVVGARRHVLCVDGDGAAVHADAHGEPAPDGVAPARLEGKEARRPRRVEQVELRRQPEAYGALQVAEGHHERVADRLHLVTPAHQDRLADGAVVRHQRGTHGLRRSHPQRGGADDIREDDGGLGSADAGRAHDRRALPVHARTRGPLRGTLAVQPVEQRVGQVRSVAPQVGEQARQRCVHAVWEACGAATQQLLG